VTVAIGAAWSLHLAMAAGGTARKVSPVEVEVTIHVADDPRTLVPAKDVTALLSRIGGISESDKKRILEGVATGFITTVRLEHEKDGESSSVTITTDGRPLSVITESGHIKWESKK